MPSKWVVVCNGDLAEWRCGCDVVVVVFNVVLDVVIVVICCCYDDVDHGELLVVISDGLAGCHVVVVVFMLLMVTFWCLESVWLWEVCGYAEWC